MSKALSSKAIVWWAVGLAFTAAVAVTVLWVFLGGGDQASRNRLDALRTAASLVVGAGGAAALLLAARRQRYVELDLEQKEHDANERRVTELYGKAADQLGSDKAPVRLAGVYALERLAQDQPQHRQTVVNLLCAYLRMPYTPPESADDTESAQEQLVRMTVQDVFETHLRPANEERFWPDIDLRITATTLEFFWFRECRVRSATFRHSTFRAIAAFRDTEFTVGADFHNTHFTGTADLRRVAFGPRTVNFRNATFDGNVDFGDEPEMGRNVDLTDATAVAEAQERVWPAGWHDEPSPEDESRVRVVPTLTAGNDATGDSATGDSATGDSANGDSATEDQADDADTIPDAAEKDDTTTGVGAADADASRGTADREADPGSR